VEELTQNRQVELAVAVEVARDDGHWAQPADSGYADLNTLNGASGNVPLSDFFSLTNQRSFTPITTPFPPSKFETYYSTPQNGVVPVPTGPDGTSGEEVE